jgi:8-oxo-dGTP pyrophosphatase MutT (NUDIX family)
MFHVVAGTCAYRPDRAVLLTQRAASKDFPLAWEFPAGSALAGESSREAAVRELAEEAGLVVDTEDLALVGRFVDSAALFDVYVVRVSGLEPLKLDPAEVFDHQWVSVAEVERRFRSGMMSGPWTVGLSALWDPFVQALRQDL